MRTPNAESAHRLGEVALLTTAFVLPIAFYLRSYDTAAIKFTILQWGSLTMLFGWLWQGISRGRFQAPASSWTALLPALAKALRVSVEELLGIKALPAHARPRSARLLQRLRQVETLPPADQRAVLKVVDALLQSRQTKRAS